MEAQTIIALFYWFFIGHTVVYCRRSHCFGTQIWFCW